MFTDNDELSGMISSMMDCGSLIILSNVDGIYTGIPGSIGSELIREVNEDFKGIGQYISTSISGYGRGGMLTKSKIAHEIASEGIHVYIANGTRDSVISDIVKERDIPSTHFTPSSRKKSGVKKWLSHSDQFARGIVYVNKGAKEALLAEKASSLLLIGVVKVEGNFRKGDIIRIFDEKGSQIGIGKSQYDSKKAEQNIGEKKSKPLIHYDYLLINEKS
jgi:glutamate 5-kinase